VPATVLVADDDPVARDLLVEVLAREGYGVRTAGGGEECLRLARQEPFDLALVDLRMPDLDGLQVLKQLGTLQPGLPVVILTAFATVDTAIQAIHAGAADYLSKPFRMEEIAIVVQRTLATRRLAQDNRHYRQELQEKQRLEHLIGQSPAMVDLYKLIARVANLDSTVLIQGETGTGKELVARAIHYASSRKEHPFVTVDCAAVPEPLFESELFGHERGAFTGALAARQGLLETAQSGTCLLDEVGELSPALQAKLLRTLQDRMIRRVGGNELFPVNVRILVATNRDLKKRVAEGAFREDLYYRLSTVTMTVPALRERASDIPALAQHFLAKHGQATQKRVKGFAHETLMLLSEYAWPGNVRELEHAIEHAVAMCASDAIAPDDLPLALRVEAGAAPPRLPSAHLTLEEMKRWYIAHVIEQAGGNKVRAAEILGIDRRTLYRILARQATEDDTGE
jgi:two-component system, NtrC family, response regulator AtoC